MWWKPGSTLNRSPTNSFHMPANSSRFSGATCPLSNRKFIDMDSPLQPINDHYSVQAGFLTPGDGIASAALHGYLRNGYHAATGNDSRGVVRGAGFEHSLDDFPDGRL